MKKEWLTPQEIAQQTGYTRQTINKWINREQWTTAPRKGIQGGRGRKVLIDDRVRQFLKTSTRQVAEDGSHYRPSTRKDPLTNLLVTSVQQMTNEEREKLTALLLREGILGMLNRLGID
ncbi:Putative transcription regulator [Izhakiella capsodis]|uniref:Transcription regulator n=1 Tax=Izhakiella capsodis TaxID=1367852 RepID=A0A1I4WHH5_9GAMM|nr:YfeC-like transcriptional regulator [Izhakiella capsodis]SFN13284.1 Putative transcription regulator [Izhakiella capsodis]